MKLKEFLKREQVSIEDFAQKMGLSYAAVRQYVNAGRVPTPKVMRRIINVTDGAVQPNDFFAANDNGISDNEPSPDDTGAA